MKDYLTTGQVAKLMGLSQRGICCLCDDGRLPATKVPGRGHDRRIHQADLAEFCVRHGYLRVLPALSRAFAPAVMSYTSSLQWGKRFAAELEGRLAVTMVLTSYELGWECCRQRPLALVLELGLSGSAEAVKHLYHLDPRPILVLLVPDDCRPAQADTLRIDHIASQSCDPALIADAILQRLAITKIQANGATHGT